MPLVTPQKFTRNYIDGSQLLPLTGIKKRQSILDFELSCKNETRLLVFSKDLDFRGGYPTPSMLLCHEP